MNAHLEINVILSILYIKPTFHLKKNENNDKAYIVMTSLN